MCYGLKNVFLNKRFCRELRDYRQRNESLNLDLKRKEKQIKDFQNRLDSEGCKLN